MSLLAQSVLVALILVMIASTVGCGGAGSPGDISSALPVSLAEPTPTSQPDGVAVTSATPLPSEVVDDRLPTMSADQELLAEVVQKVLVSEGAALAVMIDGNGAVVEAANGFNHEGQAPTSSDTFRVGSITKVFTALATLTLVEEGAVDLDAAAARYISRAAVPDGVTVRDLLQHTSGIYDAGDIQALFEAPERIWAPEEILDIWLTTSPREAGSAFTYSTSNYYFLGLLIEEVTGQPYATVIRERLLEPLDMSDTFIGHYEDGPEPFDPYLPRGAENFDYTSIATATWSAGAIVSSPQDLHTLFTALFDEQILAGDTVATMASDDRYGLGLRIFDQNLVGHDGFSPGYTTWVLHAPDTGVTTFLASTDDFATVTSAVDTLLDGLQNSE